MVSRAARPNKSCTSGHCDPEVELREESRRKRIVSWRATRTDGCPVPDWFVDKHNKDKGTWKTKKEMGTGSAKRRRY